MYSSICNLYQEINDLKNALNDALSDLFVVSNNMKKVKIYSFLHKKEKKAKNFDLDHFTKCGQFFTISTHLKKTGVSRDKLKNTKANSTPQACFFIRNLRTPKENALSVLLSMVERKGQPLAVGYVPLYVVCHPFTLYRPTVTSLAESLLNITKETAKMLYKFILLGKNRLKLSIRANTEQQARQLLNLNQQNALLIARINDKGGLYV
ncbi:ash family protein [Histophilus somni]|uniref:ash family protein n=1 Tax=Histophilus somni TaxID=731 RepID=UPI00201F40B5|nr:ash family protein [Histophilus somni]